MLIVDGFFWSAAGEKDMLFELHTKKMVQRRHLIRKCSSLRSASEKFDFWTKFSLEWERTPAVL